MNKSKKNLQLLNALQDIRTGVMSYHIWANLAWQEIQQRYRRSSIGPFWITISTGVLIACMGPLYSKLFNQTMSQYFPYLAVGLIVWQMIAAIINESGQVFIISEQFIKQIKMPLTIHALRMVTRNIIIFAHNSVVLFIVVFAYVPTHRWTLVQIIPGLLLISVNAVGIGMILGAVSARYRDIPQIVASLVQVIFFLSPIMWQRGMLGGHQWAADINPVFHLIELIRAPLLNEATPLFSWAYIFVFTLINGLVTIIVFSRCRQRIAYWV
jgi:ABC-type polysaccharide/polyol phosphate export permease